MIGIVGYAVTALILSITSCISYLVEDTLALGNLHHPSQVHSKHTEAEDRNEPVVAWELVTAESQHTVVGKFVKTYSVV